jgi:hypothetical protein
VHQQSADTLNLLAHRFDLRRGSTKHDVMEEALMLTGDENIVDVDFASSVTR